jgi:hypothetical protein
VSFEAVASRLEARIDELAHLQAQQADTFLGLHGAVATLAATQQAVGEGWREASELVSEAATAQGRGAQELASRLQAVEPIAASLDAWKQGLVEALAAEARSREVLAAGLVELTRGLASEGQLLTALQAALEATSSRLSETTEHLDTVEERLLERFRAGVDAAFERLNAAEAQLTAALGAQVAEAAARIETVEQHLRSAVTNAVESDTATRQQLTELAASQRSVAQFLAAVAKQLTAYNEQATRIYGELQEAGALVARMGEQTTLQRELLEQVRSVVTHNEAAAREQAEERRALLVGVEQLARTTQQQSGDHHQATLLEALTEMVSGQAAQVEETRRMATLLRHMAGADGVGAQANAPREPPRSQSEAQPTRSADPGARQ